MTPVADAPSSYRTPIRTRGAYAASGSPRWLRGTPLITELTPPSSRFVHGEHGVEELEQLALPEQFLQPLVAAAQLLAHPPPLAFGGLGGNPGCPQRKSVRISGYEVLPPLVPGVERLAPLGGLFDRPDHDYKHHKSSYSPTYAMPVFLCLS